MNKILDTSPINYEKFVKGVVFGVLAYVITFGVYFLEALAGRGNLLLSKFIIIILTILWLILSIKRLKGLGKSPWLGLLLFIPVANILLIIYLLLSKDK